MLDFSGLDNTSGAFPSVTAKNSSGPKLRDGTPVNADLVNDIWGAFQAILNAAGTTPSDSVESSSASDLLDSIRKLGGAPGEVVMYASPSETIDANILPLKGQVITIASYPKLVAATYVGDTANANANTNAFCKFSNALGTVKSTSGLYFKLADCRGYFLRALAGSATFRDFGRQYLTQQFTFDFHNLSGTVIDESPGIHTHDVIDVSGAQQLLTQTIYAFTSNPSVPLGGATATSMTVYKRGTGTTELLAKIGKYGSDDYGSSDFYAEVRPTHTAFQLGIRY